MSISRRDFIHLVGSTVAGAGAVAVGAQVLRGGSAVAAPAGDAVGAWSVAEVGAVEHGALPLVLQNADSGERIRALACRKGSRQQPVAQSRAYDLFLANNGDGTARTTREHELVVRALARRLDAERVAVPATVVTLEARQAQHRGLFTTADDPANA